MTDKSQEQLEIIKDLIDYWIANVYKMQELGSNPEYTKALLEKFADTIQTIMKDHESGFVLRSSFGINDENVEMTFEVKVVDQYE